MHYLQEKKTKERLKITRIDRSERFTNPRFSYLYIVAIPTTPLENEPINRIRVAAFRPRIVDSKTRVARGKSSRRRRFRNRYCSAVERNRGHARFPRGARERERLESHAWIFVVGSKTSRIVRLFRDAMQLGYYSAAHGATDGTHAPKMRVTLPKNSIHVSVPRAYDATDQTRLNFRTRTEC